MKCYFDALESEANRCYEVADMAREKGCDPELEVEIPRADDLASRVEKLLKIEGVAQLIRDIAKDHDREETSLLVAKKIAKEMAGSPDARLDRAVRVGLAVLTEGILVAPLDGIAEVKVNGAGTNSYVSLSFAGPIRSAGGTGQAMSVLITDVVRRELGIGAYRATPEEVERWKEEIPLYRDAQHLQYLPPDREVELVVGGCPVCVDGEGTEQVE
ncbi:MAG: DNA polymerase II large subunit, partial [Thermoplasmata archaeon]|nr:DNA polymerase II large subunit [Thermoplasmata archaeon]